MKSLLCVSVLASTMGAWAAAQGEKVGPEVRAAMKSKSELNVVIALKEPSSMAATRADLRALRAGVAALQDQVLSPLAASSYRIRHRYSAIPALAGSFSAAALERLAADPRVARIDADVGGVGMLAASVPLIGADKWHAKGVTGNNVVVAVLDTGLDTGHVDLADDLIQEECFLAGAPMPCPDGTVRQSGAGSAESGLNHGVATTGIITSAGTVSSVGVAPNAQIVAIKVLDNTPPSGEFGLFSEILAALNFIINNLPNVDVINMSLGTTALFLGNCNASTAFNMAGAAAVDTLRANGVITFAASGNNGSATQMSSPACLSNVVSVGATNNADQVAGFTNSNATTDLMAPGVNITSTGLANGTSTGSGTSFASPHAAGCAALLIEAGVANTPAKIEKQLKASPMVTDPKNGLMFPRIDCAAEFDFFPHSKAEFNLHIPAAGPAIPVTAFGPTTIRVDLDELADIGGLDTVPTQMVSMELTGNSPFGAFIVRIRSQAVHPNLLSIGDIQEVANNNMGILDVPPFADFGTANSTFNVFFEIEVPAMGLLFHNDDPKIMTATISNKPPADDEAYENPQLINLFDPNEVLMAAIGAGDHVPEPSEGNVEIDFFPNSKAEFDLRVPHDSAAPNIVKAFGPTTIRVDLEALGDVDSDSLEEVPAQMASMKLMANSPFGPVEVRIRPVSAHPHMLSLGEIEEKANNTPNELDVDPFNPGDANSFFDVFFELEVLGLGLTLHNHEPKRMSAMISFKPPAQGETYENPDFILLYDENENLVAALGPGSHVPDPHDRREEWEFRGEAQGGRVSADINGCQVMISTDEGESNESIAERFAEAMNDNPCLVNQGIVAEVTGNVVSFRGPGAEVTSTTVTDPGLKHNVMIPALTEYGLVALALLLLAAGAFIVKMRLA